MTAPRLAACIVALATVTAAISAAEPEFSADRIRAHVTFLADDLLDGREAGTRGHDIAAGYIASQFALLDHFGPRVRLCNVRLEELLRVEIYRRGLHSDAFCKENLRPSIPAAQVLRAS